MKLIKTELDINTVDIFTPVKLDQQDTKSSESTGWHMFEMWTSNTYVGFDYEIN